MPDPEVPPSNAPAPTEPVPTTPAPADPAPAASTAGTTGLTPNVAAALACTFPLVTGIIFLLLEKKDAFVRFYAMQSIFLGGAMLVLSIVFQFVGMILAQIPVFGWIVAILLGLFWLVLGLGFLVVYVIQLVKAFSGVEWEIPYLGELARKQLAKMPA